MKLSENRPLACGVLALVIAGSLFIGGGNALSSKAKAVNALFSASSESISAELKELADNAVVMNSIAANAKGVNETYVTAVNDAVDALRGAAGVFASADASHGLTAAVEKYELQDYDARLARDIASVYYSMFKTQFSGVARAIVVCDPRTRAAAGERVEELLREADRTGALDRKILNS